MIGSAFNNVQEAQQMAGIAVIFVVAPWLFFMPILNDPDSTVAVVTSLIPLFTPFLMMLRIAIKMPPTWQILLGYVLTFGMCVGMTWLCARVYRVGDPDVRQEAEPQGDLALDPVRLIEGSRRH